MIDTNELIEILKELQEAWANDKQEKIISGAILKLNEQSTYNSPRSQLTKKELDTIMELAEDVGIMEFVSEDEKLYECAMLEYSLHEYNKAMEQKIIIDRDEWIKWFLDDNMETAYNICERALKVGRRSLHDEIQTLDEYFQLSGTLPIWLTEGNEESIEYIEEGQMDGRTRVVWL